MLSNDTSPPPFTESHPPSLKPRFVIAGAIIGLVTLALVYYFARQRDAQHDSFDSHPVAIGRSVTVLELQSFIGHSPPITLPDLHGKVTLVNFWGPWCVYCRIEMPQLNALQKRLQSSADFKFVSVCCGSNPDGEIVSELRREAEAYLREEGYSFPVHTDELGRTRQALATVAEIDHQGFGLPLSVLFDRTGAIRGFWMGSAPGLEAAIETAARRELGIE